MISNKNQQRFTTKLHGDIEELTNLTLDILCYASHLELASDIVNQVNLVLEELYTNSVYYALPKVAHPQVIIDFGKENNQLIMIYRDNGAGFNPLNQNTPDIGLSIEERPIGGLGIFFLTTVMDEVSYCYDGKFNQITMKKNLPDTHKKAD